jgi:molecular chaperone GrpE (heat shock protein)
MTETHSTPKTAQSPLDKSIKEHYATLTQADYQQIRQALAVSVNQAEKSGLEHTQEYFRDAIDALDQAVRG